MGRQTGYAGHDGKGIDLNGHDQWVEISRIEILKSRVMN